MVEQPQILYVEDDETSRKVMEMMLEFQLGLDKTHYTILPDSTDFEVQLDTIAPRPCLIFLDIHMKPYNGFDMLQLIRAHDDYHDTQVIALTASVMNEEIEQLEAAGFDGAIAKPLQVSSFADLVWRILNGEQVWHVS